MSFASVSDHKSSSRHTSETEFWEDSRDEIRFKLQGNVWQFTADQLAKVLSAKTRDRDPSPLAPGDVDSLDNYNIHIDKFGSDIKVACQEFVSQSPEVLLSSAGDDYRGIVELMNMGIGMCLAQLPKDREVFYRNLKFCVWDKSMKDALEGLESCTPWHGAGIVGVGDLMPDQLFWSLPDEGGSQMAIPLEVNNDWRELVLQAGTNAYCLFGASPLRQFALLVGYNHKEHALRFLVFHRGSCTASVSSDLDKVAGQEGFIRSLFSIFTWRTRADAGFTAWCNNVQVCLPSLQTEARNIAPFIVDIDRVLHQTFCVRGRSSRVFCLKVISESQKRPGPTQSLGLRRSPSRIPENIGTAAAKEVLNMTRSLEVDQHRSDTTRNSSIGVVLVPNSVNPARASGHKLEDTNLLIHCPSLKLNSLERSDFNNAVMKLCWTPDRGPEYGPIESDFLQRHIMSYTGHSLLNASARDFPSLIRAILHALIGYYDMCQKNHQHCDLSIDDVLMVDERVTTQPFRIENPNPIQQEILNLCKTFGPISDQCYGFVIDGDMAVYWDTYFKDEDVGTKTGTSEFMSDWSFNQMLKNHLHSPLDDFASLYFVTQWACVFREVPQEERSRCESTVREWQKDLAGDVRHRRSVTHEIIHERLRANEYGAFLVQAQPFLKQWYSLIENLRDEFRDPPPEGWNAGIFRQIIDEVLLSFLKVVIDARVLESMV
ncbi:hypothetical protein EV360DRAFT_76380 [Lentinula raphanica]|nr:hypothetical protein EV360DRAFT_76380 [Lentinula raphanica]